jgi:hypothetical protein
MFGDSRTADVKASRDFVDGLSTIPQAVENGASSGVGDGVKYDVFVRNHQVTCSPVRG